MSDIQYKDVNLFFVNGVLRSIELYSVVLEDWVPVKNMKPFLEDENIREVISKERKEYLKSIKINNLQLGFNDWKEGSV